MAAESRRDAASLKQSLFERPHRFGFFQAVRLLRRMMPERSPVGGAHHPAGEFVRFSSSASLAFPASDIESISPPKAELDAPSLRVAFLGVATHASFGSLPDRYAQEILAHDQEKRFELREFFDLFNHRLISLYYRAWEKQRFAVAYESGGERNPFESALFAVIGMATPGLRGRLALDDRALLSRAGLLALRPVPAQVLESLVESYFGVPAQVLQFLPRWYDIDPGDLTRLGVANARLGQETVLGTRVRLAQCRFELRLGPMSWEAYQRLLPIALGFRALVDLVRLATADELDFSVRLVLEREEVPELRLPPPPDRACRLGWSTWLKSEPFERDADQAALSSQLDLSQFPTPTQATTLEASP
jgi:type VI secretion system protein ImpH